MLRRISLTVGMVALGCAAVAAKRESADPVFAQIDSIVQTLSDITGLTEKHPVPYGRMNKRQLRHFLTKRIKKSVKPEEIRADEMSLKMFGLVPQEFDLKKSTIDLLTEQAAAFYDYDTKKLFLLDDSGFESETTTLAHELSHALADQHFNLGKFMDEAPSDDDENLAHTAVVEGQASWLMLAYDLKVAGRDPVPTQEMLKTVADDGESSNDEYPVLKGAPLYIRQSLLFPYAEGTMFFDRVYQRLGKKAFAAVFTDAPVDTAQILHPERYFAHEGESTPEVPNPPLKKPGKEITEGTVGEFDHEMLLWQYVGKPEAEELAPHLRGGQFEIREAGAEKQPVLEYASVWDSEANARKFFLDYEKVLRKKWQRCDASTANRTTFAGLSDSGYFVVRWNGKVVTSVEGMPDEDDWRGALRSEVQAAIRVAFARGRAGK